MSTEAALAARRNATEAALKRVRDAITRLRREKTQVSVAAVARRAGVSRTFLYTQTPGPPSRPRSPPPASAGSRCSPPRTTSRRQPGGNGH